MPTDIITRSDATEFFRLRRWNATARTWFSKASHSLRHLHDETDSNVTRSLVGDEAGRLLVDVLGDARRLVPLLTDEAIYTFEMVEREAQGLVRLLRNERLASKMENTNGRSPEEAAMFRAKVAELRG